MPAPDTPTLKTISGSNVADVGSSLKLQCQTTTQAAGLQYTFFKGSSVLSEQENEVFLLTNLAISNSGVYTCMVSLNGVESGVSNNVQIQVSGEMSLLKKRLWL